MITRDKKLTVQASPGELRDWRAAAYKAQMSMSKWVRQVLNQAAAQKDGKG